MKLFRTAGCIDVVQECLSYFGIKLPSCLIKKKQDKFLSRFIAWRICFVDIVISCDFFCDDVQRNNFFSHSLVSFVYHC